MGRGLWSPVYPESSLSATIAVNIALNGAGPSSALYGCIGKQVLGLKGSVTRKRNNYYWEYGRIPTHQDTI